ncbi:MAG: urease subunit beta [Deltaproteobacteria bacterium]|jgi:urease subunit beta|nr:urease subunit beta [Deltaproteobacteria bacterium]
MIPGEYRLAAEDVELYAGRSLLRVRVTNAGDRPVQVGSHFHFYEVNGSLRFDRELAYGRRLAIVPGTSVRFEPGQTREVALVDFGGERRVFGFQGKVNGPLEPPKA